METSALTNNNVEAAFLELVKTIYENTGDDESQPGTQTEGDRTTVFVQQKAEQPKKSCC
jgi:hypothetical protein